MRRIKFCQNVQRNMLSFIKNFIYSLHLHSSYLRIYIYQQKGRAYIFVQIKYILMYNVYKKL